jgi:hypothetical protein
MAERLVEIPIDVSSKPFSPGPDSVRGGGTRYVPHVDMGQPFGWCPIIWQSHETHMAVLRDGEPPVRAVDCVILLNRKPAQPMRAEIEQAGIQAFPKAPVEW